MIQVKLGISTTISTGEFYPLDYLTMAEKLILTQHAALEFAATHNLKYVELSVLDPYSIKDINKKEFSDLLSSYSSKYTYHAPIFDLNLGASNELWRKASVKLAKEHIEFCKTMNVENIVFHPYRPMGIEPFFIETIVENILKSIEEISKNENTINILIENLPNPSELFSTPDIMLILENINFCFDTAHANCAGVEQKDFIESLGSRIKEVHAIDGQMLAPDMHLPIGEGDIDFKQTKNALQKINFSGPIILEAFSLEDATKSIKKLKSIF